MTKIGLNLRSISGQPMQTQEQGENSKKLEKHFLMVQICLLNFVTLLNRCGRRES